MFTSAEGFSTGIASQGGIQTTIELWVLALRDQDRDPMNRDIDNEAQGLAAEAAARQNAGRGGGAARRAAGRGPHRLERPGAAHAAAAGAGDGDWRAHPGARRPSRRAHADLGRLRRRSRRRRCRRNAGIYIIDVETGQLSRVPPAAPQNAGNGGGRGRGGAGGGLGGGGMVFSRDGRTLYFRSGSGLFAAPVPNQNAGGTGGGAPPAGGGRGGRGGAAAADPAATSQPPHAR